MKVIVDIKRSDLVWLTGYLLPRAKSNRVMVGALSAFMLLYIVATKKLETPGAFAIAIVVSLFSGIIGLLFGLLVQQFIMFLTIGKKSGVLGTHTYSISAEGLAEKTSVNENLQRWEGVVSIKKTSRFILFQINGYLFHILPRRAFANREEFNEFYEHATNLRAAA